MMILLVVLAQVSVIIGWGEHFPWVIPAWHTQGEPLGLVSIALVIRTSIAGMAGTAGWWELVDQTRRCQILYPSTEGQPRQVGNKC